MLAAQGSARRRATRRRRRRPSRWRARAEARGVTSSWTFRAWCDRHPTSTAVQAHDLDRARVGTSLAPDPGKEETVVEQNIGTWQRIGSVAGGLALLYMGARRPRVAALTRATGVGLVLRGMAGYCPVTAATRPHRGTHGPRSAGGPARHPCAGDDRHRPAPARGVRVLAAAVEPAAVHVASGAGRHESATADRTGWRPGRWATRSSGTPRSSTRWRATCWRGSRCRAATSTAPGRSASATCLAARRKLTVHLQYQPPAGKLGAWAAWLTGEEPTRQIHDDLRAVKRYLETGRRAGRALIHAA